MGKVKRGRQKAHIAAVKTKQKSEAGNDVEVVDAIPEQIPEAGKSPFLSHIFEGINIKNFNVTQNLPDFDTRSTITSKSLKELKLKKKHKQKLRHELWIKKIGAIESAKKEAKARHKKQQQPVVGDIGTLGEALPTLDLLLKGSTGPKVKREEDSKQRGIQKEKKRRKQMNDDISIFKQVFKHTAFQSDPTATISEHLHNKYHQEQMDAT